MTVISKKDLISALEKQWKGYIAAQTIRDMIDFFWQSYKETVVTAKTTTTTLTPAELLGGVITAEQGSGAIAEYTLPTGTEMDDALLSTFLIGHSFEFRVVNISSDGAEDLTIVAGSGFTVVGNVTVASNSGITTVSFAHFLALKTAANTFVLYRIG